MDSASSMCNIDRDINYLFEAICAFIHPQQFRYGGCGLCAYSARRDMLRKRRGGFGVSQERAVKVYEEELVKHAINDH